MVVGILTLTMLAAMPARTATDTIIVHHSATDTGTVESIRRYHVEVNGWDDIGYHWLVYRDGSVHAGRPEQLQGAHAKGRNARSIGICLIGRDDFTAAQLAALTRLVSEIRGRYPGAKRIERHHEECPGRGLVWDGFGE